jgi:serine/threonine-protein kinase
VRGGSPTTITEAPPNATLTWTDDDRLLYGGDGSPIREVSANSGPVRQITTAGLGAASHLYPTQTRNGTLIYSLSPVRIVSLLAPGAREPRVLVTDASQARIVMGDMLVFGRASALWAAPVDAAGTVTGEPRLVLDAVKSNGTQTPLYAVASNGTLIYAKDTGPPLRSIVWVDRSGREEVVGLPARPYRLPRVSPDGRHLLLSTADGDQNLWRIDLQRSTSTRLTFNARPDFSPVWSFDGRTVFFTDTERVLRVRADGEGDVQVVLAAPEVSPTGITPDGKTLIVSGPGIQKDGRPNAHVGLLPLDVPRVIPLITDPGEQRNGTVSPDGRWLAYQSSESGQLEIYVRPFPDVARGKWQVSVGGGLQPIWSRNGRELFYRTRAGQVLAVSVRSGATLEVDPPKIIVTGAYAGDDVGPARSYDVTPDGQRFLFVKNLAGTDITRLELVLNWDLALRASLANTGR